MLLVRMGSNPEGGSPRLARTRIPPYLEVPATGAGVAVGPGAEPGVVDTGKGASVDAGVVTALGTLWPGPEGLRRGLRQARPVRMRLTPASTAHASETLLPFN